MTIMTTEMQHNNFYAIFMLSPVRIIILDLPQLPHLSMRGHKMKTPHASSGILEINYKSPPGII